MKRIIEKIKRNYISVICSVIIVFICFLNGMGAKYLIDFYPINGTFQNYNPVRRWLDGQVPVRDFNTYLGFGHLLLGGTLTWFLGGDYAASLCAFSFLTLLSVAAISYVLGKSILRSGRYALVSTVIFLVILVSRFVVFSGDSILSSVFGEALGYSLTPGNSARFIRGVAPALYVLVVEFLLHRIRNSKYYAVSNVKKREVIELILFSAAGGLFFTYSNDYGISTWLCVGITCVFIELSRKRSFFAAIKILFGYIVISLLSVAVFVILITGGHIKDWLRATFGTGGFQTWYYLSGHSYYIYDVDFSFLMMIQAFLVIYYGICVFRCKADGEMCKRYGIPALLNMTAFCAANEYKMLSGGFLHEVSYAILGVTIGYEIILTFKRLLNPELTGILKKRFVVAVLFIGGAWCVSSGISRGISFLNTERGTYIDELGGYMTGLSKDLMETREFINDQKVFATYASALEAVTDQYQPSGYDYIIHVLGEEAREDYLESFKQGDFDYVATIRPEFTDWENWVKGANWFFYRELYHDYHPVYCNSYELFWEKNQMNEEDLCIAGDRVDIEVQPLNDSQFRIIVRSKEIMDGIVDLNLTYRSEKANVALREKLMWFSCVNVKNTTQYQIYKTDKDTFNLPKEGNTNIPITMVDGVGEVVISSQPNKFTRLYIDEITCSQIFLVDFSYIDLIGEAGQVSKDECMVTISNNELNSKIVENISQLSLDEEQWNVIDTSADEDSIYLKLTGDAEVFNEHMRSKNVVRVK